MTDAETIMARGIFEAVSNAQPWDELENPSEENDWGEKLAPARLNDWLKDRYLPGDAEELIQHMSGVATQAAIAALKEAEMCIEPDWKPITKQPDAGNTYQVWTTAGPAPGAPDIAYYEGRRPDGEHWWIMSNINIDQKTISHWREVRSPFDDDSDAAIQQGNK